MSDSKQAYPPEHHLYEQIRELCAGQEDFDELEFGPLFGQYPDVLSVTGAFETMSPENAIMLTLWRGTRKGRGSAGASPGLWIRIIVDEAGMELRDATYAVDVTAADLGVDVAYFSVLPTMERGARLLVELFDLAEPSHAGLVGAARQQSFDQLNEAIQDGFEEADAEDDYFDEDENDSDLALHSHALNSGFESISFAVAPVDGFEVFFTHVVLPAVAGKVRLSAWIGPETGERNELDDIFMLDVEGAVQRMPAGFDDEIALLPGSGVSREQVRVALQHLKPIHMHAFNLYVERMDGFRFDVCQALKAISGNALAGGDPLPLDVVLPDIDLQSPFLTGADYHEVIEEYTRVCRLGLLAGVVAEESPHGPGLNVRAAAIDPITKQMIPLQVFWKVNEDGSGEPEHWLSAGQASEPAHGGDPLHPELLSGFPQAGREHLLHAIQHLHDLGDFATEIVAAKDAETQRVLEVAQAGSERELPEIVKAELEADALENVLAALNGIARLYTGHADRGVRDS